MEELFNDIGKRMPYRESEEHLDTLIDKATENAINHQVQTNRRSRLGVMLASAAAVALLVLGIGFTLFKGQDKPATTGDQGPLDEFLSTLSDEEAAQLSFYEIEEIPEY